MTTYKILRDSDSFMEFAIDLEEMLDEIGQHTGELEFMHFSQHNLKLQPYWKKFQGTFKKVRTGATQIPDITCWRGATLVLSEKAHNKLAETLTPYGEFLPITCNDAPYYIFNCLELAILDAAKNASDSSNNDETQSEEIAFNNSSIQGKSVFKSLEQGCTAVFCNDDFKNKVANEHLTGIKFSVDLTEIF